MNRRTRTFLSLGAAIAALVIAILVVVATNPAVPDRCDGDDVSQAINIQRQLRVTGDGIELELWSRQAFPVRAISPTLRIGDREFASSRYGTNGSLNTLIFSIPSSEFDRLATGDGVLVYHGFIPEEIGADPNGVTSVLIADLAGTWTFGLLDKSRLDCPAHEVPPLR